MTSVNDTQIGGSHYKSLQYEHWDFASDIYGSDHYLKGCCTKYLVRWKDKNGIEDLKKSYHYLQKLIEKSGNMDNIHIPNDFFAILSKFVSQLPSKEADIVYSVYTNNFKSAKKDLEELIRVNSKIIIHRSTAE
jgi:hypothetical protein